MKTSASPCTKCYSHAVCDAHDGICGDWRRWFNSVWPKITMRAECGVTALHLHNAGKNDRQIAVAVGVSTSAVCQWRKRNDLPPNGKRGRPESEAPTC